MSNELEEVINNPTKYIQLNTIDGKNSIKFSSKVVSYLELLKEIMDSGDCNICGKKNNCAFVPEYGKLVRFNCAFYEKRED